MLTEQQWNDFLKRSKGWSVRMSFELLHSRAYRDLNYSPALKVLCWFHEKIKVEVDKRKRGKGRYQIANDGEMDFTYREAAFRELTPHRFRNALIELHRLGFIDIKHPGSALRGDWTVFKLSDRWKGYGTPAFENPEIPRSVCWINKGFGSKKTKKVNCRNRHLS